MENKMAIEEKKKKLEEMLRLTEDFDDLEKAHLMGYVQGMVDSSQLRKKEAS